VNINQVVKEAVELLAYELRTSNVEVTLDLASDPPVLYGDAHQLHQVIVNLLANANHAMRSASGPKRLTVTTAGDRDARVARVEIADTGPGIPLELQERIFEPFFTTKPPGEGTGLGLSLCRSIVETHEGAMNVASAPGAGARFVIELPVRERTRRDRASVADTAVRPTGPKRLLVVDDEREIAEVLHEALARSGHQVDIATDGASALEMLGHHPYDLVLTDTRMPVMDGLEMYRALEQRAPHMRQRLIFMTGDVLNREKEALLQAAGVAVIAKPFDVQEVVRIVHRVLADTVPS